MTYFITYACGHTASQKIGGSKEAQARKLKLHLDKARSVMCPECVAKAAADKRKEKLAARAVAYAATIADAKASPDFEIEGYCVLVEWDEFPHTSGACYFFQVFEDEFPPTSDNYYFFQAFEDAFSFADARFRECVAEINDLKNSEHINRWDVKIHIAPVVSYSCEPDDICNWYRFKNVPRFFDSEECRDGHDLWDRLGYSEYSWQYDWYYCPEPEFPQK